MVTKAVGDLLGVTGIADEAIRFNGYPFLEKDDHVYDVPGMKRSIFLDHAHISCLVSTVMRRDLHTFRVSGMTLRDVGKYIIPLEHALQCIFEEAQLASTSVKGFPVISDDENRTLMGYVGRTELRYVIGM